MLGASMIQRSGSSRRRGLFVAAILLGLTAPAFALAAQLSPAHDVTEAAAFRALHSDLMVAALICRNDQTTGVVGIHNQFVTRFQPLLAKSAQTLEGHFAATTSAAQARVMLDNMTTRIANAASLRFNRRGETCGQTAARFSPLLKMAPQQILDHAFDIYGTAPTLVALLRGQ
ncbi:MAG: hypothetical protein RIC83_05675 [Alphaproteobacteria bacterium]